MGKECLSYGILSGGCHGILYPIKNHIKGVHHNLITEGEGKHKEMLFQNIKHSTFPIINDP